MLRAAQLTRGCIPKIDGGTHKFTVIAQIEVAALKVGKVGIEPVIIG